MSLQLDELAQVQFQITGLLLSSSRNWKRLCQSALMNHGISEACAAPLLVIGRLGDGVRQVTVAQAAGIEGPSLVRLLDQLCANGYVCRSEDPLDRRAKSLSLTDTGRALADTLELRLVELRRQVLAGVSKADLEATLRVLRLFEPGTQG
ncbi:MarR family winged helix-turn-helix transcriptional regulator [Pseudomonas matsuisoli]|uniref:MarR family transcriptional regulator n=1 Tax=Pseudomonas matsuisoli TaxID=1515666 RepID=A0A917V1T6_9PSED|nr:MarR family transcriptional regulator [Pseudomonas matsuisoli]GGK09679.1 MarR family transcriptional regulator [Pseudomonas matsuisoli]